MAESTYSRNPTGILFDLGGLNTETPLDAMPAGKFPYCQNARAYHRGRVGSRVPLGSAVATITGAPAVNSVARLNDQTPSGPSQGYAYVIGAGTGLYAAPVGTTPVTATSEATGLSGNPVAMVPFRPNNSVQPWMYCGDSSTGVSVTGYSGYVDQGAMAGMVKVRSDGLTYKTGIKEPQVAPTVGTGPSSASGSLQVSATTVPWDPNLGTNLTNYDYTFTATTFSQPAVIAPPQLQSGATVVLTLSTPTQTISVNGGATTGIHAYTAGSTYYVGGRTYPGTYLTQNPTSATALIGAFTDAIGQVIAVVNVQNPVVVSAASGTTPYQVTLIVPPNAVQLQLGINDTVFTGNGASYFSVSWTVTVANVTNNLSTSGQTTVYQWNDSPHSGPTGSYIWKNPNDMGALLASGTVVREAGTQASTYYGNSLLLPSGSPGMNWQQFLATDTLTPTGVPIVVGGGQSGDAYQNFNLCIVGELYVPAAGTYNFTIATNNDILWGIGGDATWGVSTDTLTYGAGPGGGTHPSGTFAPSAGGTAKGSILGAFGQTMTVISGLPLLPGTGYPAPSSAPDYTLTVPVTFPAAGLYPVEIDFDYFDSGGPSVSVTVTPPGAGSAQNIPNITSSFRQNVQYEYVYRSSKTGAQSNPSPPSTLTSVPLMNNAITATPSTDPQVDKIDFYRVDSSLDNYTYVLTVQNSNPTGVDTLSDTAVAGNQILQLDNFEPFPVVDLPRSGTVTVSGGVVTWASGDLFNVRWLPGTIINIGATSSGNGAGVGYVLTQRPTSTTTLLAGDVPSTSTPVAYEIAAPGLAAQPLNSFWGPTPSGFMMAVGDALNPGKFYWTKGNMPDSAPDTNQQDLTSPSEPLVNGCISNGQSVIFSTERAWIVYPTFTSAAATVTGDIGSTWNPVNSGMGRGLFCRNGLAVDGSGNIFFIAKDCIAVSAGGGPEVSITDEDLYGLFPHEGVAPLAPSVTIGPTGYQVTIYAPDFSTAARREAQKLAIAGGYLYYDYLDSNGNQRNLVFDIAHKAWIVDVYANGAYSVSVHSDQFGAQVDSPVVGTSDGNLRQFVSGGGEAGTALVYTPAVNGGDVRGQSKFGDLFLKGNIQSSTTVAVQAFTQRYAQGPISLSTNTLAGTGASQKYLLDFVSDGDDIVDDVEISVSWALGTTTLMELWQPNWINQPEYTKDRSSDWDDGGTPGLKFIQGMMLEADTANVAKAFALEDSDTLTLHYPDQSPVTFNGQSVQALTFTPPFLAHSVRRVALDGVLWRVYHAQLVFQPYPESVAKFTTEFTSHENVGWQSIREMNLAYNSTAAVTVTLNFDQWPSETVTFPSSGGVQIKTKMPTPVNKFKLVQYVVTSTAPFYLFKEQCEVKLLPWGRTSPARIVNPFGGPSGEMAVV